MRSSQIRQKFLDFYAQRGHAILPSSPLVPENDPTTLFTSSGMQPMVPFLLGEPHPSGKRLVDSQKSFRTQDIEEVGDNRHTTFFEMLGNWSLGDYFKKEQLSWIFEFLTQIIGLDPKRLYVTVFAGDESVPKDNESISIWKEVYSAVGIDAKEGERIFPYPAKKNWWSRSGEPENMPTGEPGGPDSEIFFDFGENLKLHENSPWSNEPCHVNCDCGRFLEIANSVFMQYQKMPNGVLKELEQKNVDFGGGLERLTAASSDNPDVFQTDLFEPIISGIEKSSNRRYVDASNQPTMRVIADHLKAASFLISDGVLPSNKAQGYFLRRLIRRAVFKMMQLGIPVGKTIPHICNAIINIYNPLYFSAQNWHHISSQIGDEAEKFLGTLHRGHQFFESQKVISEEIAFDLFQSYGYPFELTQELAAQKGFLIDKEKFENLKKKHQDLSRTASKGMFKGGLQDQSETTIRYHTATHLLHKALRDTLGDHVHQAGSNITGERLRFDFTHPGKLTLEEIKNIENTIDSKIDEYLPVVREEMPKQRALKEGALAFFPEKYPETTSVYTIGQGKNWYSKELCGGPHVTSTGKIGHVTITKEESLGSGVRRIYAQLSQPR